MGLVARFDPLLFGAVCMTGCVLARAVRLWRSRRCWLRVAFSCCVVCDVCVKWAYTCIDTYVCVCKDTCSDFGSISHVRCTYTIKDVSTISHLRCANTCAYFFQLFFNSDLPSIYLIRSVDGRISSSILPRWDLFFHRCRERGQLKSCAQRTEIHSTSRKCGGWGMPLWAALSYY